VFYPRIPGAERHLVETAFIHGQQVGHADPGMYRGENLRLTDLQAKFRQDQTSRTGIDRRDGFTKQMAAKHPNVKIVDIQYGGGDQLKSTDIAKAVIQSHPNLKGYFGANEGSIIGVLNAVKELKMDGKITVIGYDSGKQQIDAIKAGTEAGAITQDPIGIGYKCVEAAVKAIKGESVPKNIDTGFYWYDKSNIADPKIAAVLYQ
ncbi:MAG TPA: substrate-binding domain-containing protein, partial [Thermoflexales bacterium]|nr:substrate-binding domain-containing protein [Thermoflexales bacterium]